MNGNLTDTTTVGSRGSGSNDNEEVLHISQMFGIKASSSDIA